MIDMDNKEYILSGDIVGVQCIPTTYSKNGITIFSKASRIFGWRIRKWIAGVLFFDTITHFFSWIQIWILRKAGAVFSTKS